MTHPQSVNLVWFRNDLRVKDNSALAAALTEKKPIIAAFFICEPQWQLHGWGRLKTQFVMAHAHKLSESLKEKGIGLIVRSVKSFALCGQELLKICENYNCVKIFANREYEWDERSRDIQVTQQFKGTTITTHWFDDGLVVAPGEILTKSGDYFKKFTPFKRAWFEKANIHAIKPISQNRSIYDTSAQSELDILSNSNYSLEQWPIGEKAAQKILSHFIKNKIKQYDIQRDLPYEEGTSRISPYLSAGILGIREIFWQILRHHKIINEGIEVWVSELIWREFYKHIVFGFPHVCKNRPFDLTTEAVPWRHAPEEYEAWCKGQTGYPIVDAGMRQLNQEGWMHNRLRMICASFLAKHLLIDWRLGEAYFAKQLIDFDFAANNGGWQWSASTGTDAMPYFRIFNPILQGKKFDKEAEYIKHYVPELQPLKASDIYKIHLHPKNNYFHPIVQLEEGRDRCLLAFKQR